MHWADKIANDILESGRYKPYRVDDMKTPSGRVHIGSVRAFLTHAFVARALRDRGSEVSFSYVFEDHDPFDKLPNYIDAEKFSPYLGMPLYKVPAPEPGYENYAQRWAEEYREIFRMLDIEVEIIWGSELYLSGKMNSVVRECLDQADKIREIYKELYKQDKGDEWFPVNMVCEQCGKLSTTEAYGWDGKTVSYKCLENRVDWTNGCGFEGKGSPFDGRSKLPWKVEWPCKWKVVGVTIEGAGKDHMSEGGSHDFAKLMCEKVINYPVPYPVYHEFFLTDGKKMSSSKGVGSSAKEVTTMVPAFLVKYAIARVKNNQAIDFDPEGMLIPDLFDGFDEAADKFWHQPADDLARVFELSVVGDDYKEKLFLPRFRDVAKFLQDPKVDPLGKFTDIKGSELTGLEKDVLEERIKFARIWLNNYAPADFVFQISSQVPDEANNLTELQMEYLKRVSELLSGEVSQPEDLQQKLYDLSKEVGLPAKDAFGAIYMVLIGKTHGPKAAWMILENLDTVRDRLNEVLK